MKPNLNANWIELVMFSMIALLAGGWLIYYINDTAEVEAAPRYYLYKVVRDESKNTAPLSNPQTGYGKITVIGKITGTSAMAASLNDYFQVDRKYWQDYEGKFVEATGYLTQSENQTNDTNRLRLDIKTIELAAKNNVDDADKPCGSSLDCRNLCVIATVEYEKQCSGFDKTKIDTYCTNVTGKCSGKDLSQEEVGDFIILNGQNIK
jgi:hypothetical protein